MVDSEATKVLTPVPGLGPFVKEAKGSRGPVFSKATDISRLPRLSGGPEPRGAILGPGAKWGPATLLKDEAWPDPNGACQGPKSADLRYRWPDSVAIYFRPPGSPDSHSAVSEFRGLGRFPRSGEAGSAEI